MGKYRHKVTGVVRELDDRYAKAVSAFEPVSDDTEVSPEPCGPCGIDTSAGAEEYAETAPMFYDEGDEYEEPTYRDVGE